MTTTNKGAYGKRLSTARKAKGLTQAELAQIAHCKPAMVSKIERGGQESTTFTVALAKALGVRSEWLAHGMGEMHATKGDSDSYTSVEIPLLAPKDVWQYVRSKILPGAKPIMLKSPIFCNDGAFAVQLQDDSMLSSTGRSYPKDKIVYIDPVVTPADGSRVLAAYGDATPVFRLYREDMGKRWLVPLNMPQWEKVELTEGWRILGVAVFSGDIE